MEHRYKPRERKLSDANSGWDTTNKNIQEIIQRYDGYGVTSFKSATLQEERERELAPEIEEEREEQNPASMKSKDHGVHPDLVRLIDTGVISAKTDAFIPALKALEMTSAAKVFDL